MQKSVKFTKSRPAISSFHSSANCANASDILYLMKCLSDNIHEYWEMVFRSRKVQKCFLRLCVVVEGIDSEC